MKQREIKFRCWDKEDQEFIYAEPVYGFFANLPMECESNHEEGKRNRKDRYGDIQEFTGLKDKKGVEIYEGDIVNHGDNYPSIVRFGKNTYGFELEERGYSKKKDGYTARWHEFISCTSPIEVIGNIYDQITKEK